MNHKILKKLTFGFEIEGLFRKGLDDNLGNKGIFKTDGSVHGLGGSYFKPRCTEFERCSVSLNYLEEIYPNIRDCDDCRLTLSEDDRRFLNVEICPEHDIEFRDVKDSQSISTEYESAVYFDFTEVLKDVKLFSTEKNHVFNDTCGLHLHVGMKDEEKWRKLYGAAEDWELQKQIFEQAKNYCPCQLQRLTGVRSDGRAADSFCKLYPRKEIMRRASHGKPIKYSFMNFHHEHKTLEFRFLCPCEHKVENIKKLMDTLTGFLGKDSHETISKYAKLESTKQRRDYTAKEKPKTEKIDIIKKMFQLDFFMVRNMSTRTQEIYYGYDEHYDPVRPLTSWEIQKLPAKIKGYNNAGELWKNPEWQSKEVRLVTVPAVPIDWDTDGRWSRVNPHINFGYTGGVQRYG